MDFTPNRRMSSFGVLCPTQIGKWRYHNHSFQIPNNGIHKKLELHFGQAAVTRPFFKFREEAFEWGSHFGPPLVQVFVLGFHSVS